MSIQLVTFELNGEIYGLDVMQTQEVLRLKEISPVAGTVEYVLGIINIRGSVVTVIDLRKMFDVEPTEVTDTTRIVVTESPDNKGVVGMMVDCVAEVVEINEADIQPSPSAIASSSSTFITGVVTIQDHGSERLLIILDFVKIFDKIEDNE